MAGSDPNESCLQPFLSSVPSHKESSSGTTSRVHCYESLRLFIKPTFASFVVASRRQDIALAQGGAFRTFQLDRWLAPVEEETVA